MVPEGHILLQRYLKEESESQSGIQRVAYPASQEYHNMTSLLVYVCSDVGCLSKVEVVHACKDLDCE